MPETQVVIPDSKTVVITSENSAEFYAKKLDLAPQSPIEDKKPVEAAPVEAPKEEAPPEEVKEEKPEKKKGKPINERFSEIAAQKNAAIERAEAAEKRAAELEAKAREIEAKLNPPKEDGKPDPAKYTDAFKYAEDLAKWTTEQTLAQRDKAEKEAKVIAEQEEVAKNFKARQEKVKKELEDYEEKVGNSEVVVSPELTQEIYKSDFGPQLLYHFAEHPEDADRISKMTIAGMLKAVGRLEATFEKKPEPKAETKVETKAEISKAPEPITPINGGKGVPEVPIDSKGEFTGDYKTWKTLRKQGKIH